MHCFLNLWWDLSLSPFEIFKCFSASTSSCTCSLFIFSTASFRQTIAASLFSQSFFKVSTSVLNLWTQVVKKISCRLTFSFTSASFWTSSLSRFSSYSAFKSATAFVYCSSFSSTSDLSWRISSLSSSFSRSCWWLFSIFMIRSVRSKKFFLSCECFSRLTVTVSPWGASWAVDSLDVVCWAFSTISLCHSSSLCICLFTASNLVWSISFSSLNFWEHSLAFLASSSAILALWNNFIFSISDKGGSSACKKTSHTNIWLTYNVHVYTCLWRLTHW